MAESEIDALKKKVKLLERDAAVLREVVYTRNMHAALTDDELARALAKTTRATSQETANLISAYGQMIIHVMTLRELTNEMYARGLLDNNEDGVPLTAVKINITPDIYTSKQDEEPPKKSRLHDPSVA